MNDQSQTYETPMEHIIYLREFDLARETAEKNMAGKDGEADFRTAADRAREWVKRKDRQQAGRVLQAAKTAHDRSTALTMLVA